MRGFNIVVMVAVAAAACSKQESAAGDTSKMPAAGAAASAPVGVPVAAKLGETPGMKTPESVRYDPELDVFYVSNINGNPSQHDGNGFIAVVRADSTGVTRMLVEGGKNGAKLDAPKGLALVGDTLWVADINHLRAFNRKTGAPIADIDLSSMKASFLNDVAVGGDGSIYATDSGLLFDAKGAMTHPGTDQIFKVTGRKATAIRADSLNAPNGITWDAANGRFLLAPFSGTVVQTWKTGDKMPTTLVTGPGTYDGIEALADGRILVTSWADSAVHVIQNGAMSKLISNLSGPADIGVDTKRGVVAIPLFNDGKVEYYKIP
ncbi:MAG: SMP-30/gluconolactonase/LRE family protein [bacterium]